MLRVSVLPNEMYFPQLPHIPHEILTTATRVGEQDSSKLEVVASCDVTVTNEKGENDDPHTTLIKPPSHLSSACSTAAMGSNPLTTTRITPLTPNSVVPCSRLLPRVSWDDISARGLLGSGSFCDVYKVEIKNPSLDIETRQEERNEEEPNQRHYYALKCLSERAMKDETNHMVATMDLAFESKILSQLNHPNIITLYATNHEDFPSTRTQAGVTPMLLLGMLNSTLHDKLTAWRTASSSKSITSLLKSSGSPSFSSSFRTSKDGESGGPIYNVSRKEAIERLESTAMGIVQGMEYLHEKKIVLRDLKPGNVGYTDNGTVQLFDFGLSQYVVDPSTTSEDPIREMAGSLRYMAPENALMKGCGLSSDVYSFGILLWELYTLKRPYAQFKSVATFRERVFSSDCRPSLRGLFSTGRGEKELCVLLEECWAVDPAKRPTFLSIRAERLPAIIASLKDDDQEAKKRTLSSSLHSIRNGPMSPRSFRLNLSSSWHQGSNSNQSKSQRSFSRSISTPELASLTTSEAEHEDGNITEKEELHHHDNNKEDAENDSPPAAASGRSQSISRLRRSLSLGLGKKIPSFKSWKSSSLKRASKSQSEIQSR